MACVIGLATLHKDLTAAALPHPRRTAGCVAQVVGLPLSQIAANGGSRSSTWFSPRMMTPSMANWMRILAMIAICAWTRKRSATTRGRLDSVVQPGRSDFS